MEFVDDNIRTVSAKNMSENETNDFWDNSIPTAVRVTVVGFVSIAVILTNMLNLIVLHLTKQIPSIAKVCLINLSIADLTSGAVCMTPCVYSAVTGVWPYGVVWCQIAGVIHGTCCSVSIWSLAVVSIDRYIAIKTPLRYPSRMTTRRCLCSLASIWTIALLTFLLPCAMSPRFIYYQFDTVTGMCGMYWAFSWLCIATGIYIPVASGSIILFTTVSIVRQIGRQARKRLSMTSAVGGSLHKAANRRDNRAIKILCITAGIYFAAWGPYVTEVFLISFAPDVHVPEPVGFSLLWLANSNSFMNVVIYSAVYKSFRFILFNILRCLITCNWRVIRTLPRESETSM